ncbi:hypothetical protein [Kribbella sp. NPDC049584]|uniref:hypothetical protein n=1 Tax=Kribbella sp. NPDC049584 TaxID=3154833 RepID=UPI003434B439
MPTWPVIASTGGDPGQEVYRYLGSGHSMWAYADLYYDDRVIGRTRGKVHTWFGGIVYVHQAIVVDAAGTVVGWTNPQTLGVDGTIFGAERSDRTVFWNEPLIRSGMGGPPVRVMMNLDWEFQARAIGQIIEVVKVVAPVIAALV